MRLGAHMSTSGGIWKALERGLQIGCDSVQVFVKNNMQWLGRPYATPDIAKFREYHSRGSNGWVIGHTGYLINLAAPASPNREKSIHSLVQEIELATSIGLPFLVLHPGAHLGAGESAGLKQVVDGLNQAFRLTSSSAVRIALENTAGQGSCLGCKLEDLGRIYEQVERPERLGLCLDTAHFFAAGYDIRSPKGWDAAIDQIGSLVGINQIVAFHLNDSKTDLGSHVDRHAHIGQGKIGREAFRHIVNDSRFRLHPACLETPKSDDLREDIENLNVLRSLLASAPSALNGQALPRPEAKPKARARKLSPKPGRAAPKRRAKAKSNV
jgi:deoxyribonuclease IV